MTSEHKRVAETIGQSRKYRDISRATIEGLAEEARGDGSRKGLEKRIRKRLHQIVADHLGDPDYDEATRAWQQIGPQRSHRLAFARTVLEQHLTTRERLPFVTTFYREIFALTGVPNRLIDLACGLNPVAIPWMGLPGDVCYRAYDIHERRIAFLNRFLLGLDVHGHAEVRDIVFEPISLTPTADVALLLKELHRLWKNYRGLSSAFLDQIPARHLVISFPVRSAHGGRGLTEHYRRAFGEFIADRPWVCQELIFPDELVFCIDKG